MKTPTQRLYEYALKMLDEAESNVLDAYAGTSDEPSIRASYNRKRGHLRRLAREAGAE